MDLFDYFFNLLQYICQSISDFFEEGNDVLNEYGGISTTKEKDQRYELL